ncbi:glutathione S-transferase family protein [Altererythrobacter sp. MF3-039]|uniref:glutathione S-transferase family protein n=1 Tax=Altererythrobacter sp. MF3-039 TaxID=3252901 RepID=UPI00390C99DF
MTKPILHTCAKSRGFRATWAAEEAETDIELAMLPFPPRVLKPEYLEVNPLGTVPMLEHDEVRMTESCAIAVYLAGIGEGSALVIGPGEPDYAEFLDFTYHADATITFPQTVFMRFVMFEKDRGLQEAGEAYGRWFHKRLVKLEQRLAEREYLCADRFTVADICCGYALVLAETVGLDDGVPDSLKAYRERLTARDGYRRAEEREMAAAPPQKPIMD